MRFRNHENKACVWCTSNKYKTALLRTHVKVATFQPCSGLLRGSFLSWDRPWRLRGSRFEQSQDFNLSAQASPLCSMTYVAAAFVGNPEPKPHCLFSPRTKAFLQLHFIATEMEWLQFQAAEIPWLRGASESSLDKRSEEADEQGAGGLRSREGGGKCGLEAPRTQRHCRQVFCPPFHLLLLILPFPRFADPSPCHPGARGDWVVFCLESTSALKLASFQSTNGEQTMPWRFKSSIKRTLLYWKRSLSFPKGIKDYRPTD